jgi:hypothetical protein
MNNTVTIVDNAAIDDTALQTFINKIKTMNNTFSYSSGSTTGFAPTFDEMTSAKDITLTMAGDISFKKLASAGTIEIHDDYETKITSVDFGAMTSVTGLTTDEAGVDATTTVRLNSATNLDLASLARYGTALTIQIKKGGTLDITALNDINAAGTAVEAMTLAITGPDSVTLSKIDDGTITLTDVNTVTVSDFYGSLVVSTGVKTLTTTKSVKVDISGASNLETATLNMVNDYDPALTTAAAALSAAGNSSTYTGTFSSVAAAALKTLTLTGNWLDLTLDTGENNLETLSIDGTMDDLSIDGLTDLTSLTVSATSKMGDVTLQNTTNLAVADFDHAFIGTTTGTTAATSSTVTVKDNSALTTLHYAADDVGTLTVTGNDALTAIDFTGLADDGGDLTPAANVYDNNLTATSASNTSDGDTNRADGLTTDLGSFDDGTSGMDSLKAYLTHVVADADFAGYVSFDTVSTETDTETAGSSTVKLNVTYTNATTFNEATVLYEVAQVSATTGGAAKKSKRSLILDTSRITTMQFYAGGALILDINGDGAPAKYDATNDTTASIVAALNDADNVARASSNGVTFSAQDGGRSTAIVHIGTELDSALWETNAGAVSGINLTASDIITFTLGNATVTTTVTTNQGSAMGKIQAVTDAVQAAWVAKVTTASAVLYNFESAQTEASSTLSTSKGASLTFAARDIGSGGEGHSISLTAASVDGTTIPQLPVAYGPTRATNDNLSAGADVIVTFESNVAGVAGNEIGLPATTATSGTFAALTISHVSDTSAEAGTNVNSTPAIAELHSNLRTNSSTAPVVSGLSGDGHTDESRSDVRYPEDDNTLTTVTTTAVAKNRIAWLG